MMELTFWRAFRVSEVEGENVARRRQPWELSLKRLLTVLLVSTAGVACGGSNAPPRPGDAGQDTRPSDAERDTGIPDQQMPDSMAPLAADGPVVLPADAMADMSVSIDTGPSPDAPEQVGAPDAPAGAGGADVVGLDATVGGPDVPPDTQPSPDAAAAPPVPNSASVKILATQTDLLGSFHNGCTSGPGADRWCAVSRPFTLVRRELWLVNVSRAAATGTLVESCDVPGLCLRASSNLYTAQPEAGPSYPEDAARASGNTFSYLTDPVSAASDAFQGDVWVHTIGSPSATLIGDNVFDCAVAGQRHIDLGRRIVNKVAGICVGDPSSTVGAEANFFTLFGGAVPGQEVPATPLTTPPVPLSSSPLRPVQTIYPIHPGTMAARWRVAFTADGETLVLSTGGAGVNDVERLMTIRTDDIGTAIVPTLVPGGEGTTRWTISEDEQRIFYLKDFNYNVDGNQSGTLTVADFPSGTNARPLLGVRVPGGNSGGIGAYRLLTDRAGVNAGVGFLSYLTMGRGDYSIIKNLNGSLDDAANVVSVTAGSRSLPVPSPDLRFSVLARAFAVDTPTSDVWVVGNDGSNQCVLSRGELGGFFGSPFTRSAGIMFWTDDYNPATFAADGWLTDPADCTNNSKKRNFARGVDFWFVDADRLLLYSDESDGTKVTLKYAYVTGSTLGSPVTIQTRADRLFHIILDPQPTDGSPPRFKGITYKISGAGPEVNGIYYYAIPPPPG